MLARHNRLDSCYKVKDYMKILRNGIGLLWNFGIYGNVIPLIPSGKLKCRFCHKVFWFSSSLSDHIKISHMRREGGEFLTSPCGADVSTFDIIANAIVGRKKENFEHMRKEDMYACIYETCSSVKHHGIATSVSSYKRVIVVSRSPSPMILYDVYLTSGWHCVVCGKQFPDRKLDLALQAHECSSKSSVIYIASSIRFGKQLEDFDVTFKMPGSKWEMQCKECKVSVSQYSYHEHKCIEKTAQPPIRKLRCVGCNELFSMSTFVSHMMSAHTMKRECNICHKLLDSFDTNEKHVCIPSKSYHTTKRDIRKERSLLLDSFDTNEKHVCIPSKSYHTTKRDIRKERSLLDVELKSKKNDVPILELACYWKCIACMKSFRNLELLNSHIFKSHAALMKSCRFCEELILVDISQHHCQGKDEIKYAHRLAMLKGWMGTTMKHDIRMKCVKCSCLKHFCKKNVFPYQCHQNTCCLYCSRYASCAGAECRHCGGIFHKISHLKMHMLYQHDTTVEDNKHITAVEDKIESESESEDIFREVVENKREYLSRLAEKVLQRSNMKRKMEKEANDLQQANMKRKMEKEAIDSLHSSKTRITSEANSLQMTTEPVVNSKAPKIRPARKRGARSPETLQRKRLRQEARQEANTCKICFEKCKNKKSLRKHMSAEHGVRKAQQEANTCKLCSEKCGNKIAFKKHMSAAHGVRTGAGKPRPTPYSCKLCSEKFSSRKALRKHVTAEHGIISDKSGFLTSKKMAVCDECGLAVGSGYMGTHKRRQHQVQEELYQCDVCQEKFHLQIKLKDHLSDVHSVPTKTSSFVLKEEHYLPSALTECKYCGEKVLKKAISRHIRLLHEKKPVMCDVCGLMYPSASKLYSHKQRHVAARRKKQNVSCPDCGKIVSKYSLKSHQKINHSKKNFVCEECGKRFSFAHMLNAHIRFIHEGHKPFTCDICNYKCYMKSSLRGHMKNHHS